MREGPRLERELARGGEDEAAGAGHLGVGPEALEEREQEGGGLAAARAGHGDHVGPCARPRAARVSRRPHGGYVGPGLARGSPARASGSVLRWIGVGTRNLFGPRGRLRGWSSAAGGFRHETTAEHGITDIRGSAPFPPDCPVELRQQVESLCAHPFSAQLSFTETGNASTGAESAHRRRAQARVPHRNRRPCSSFPCHADAGARNVVTGAQRVVATAWRGRNMAAF